MNALYELNINDIAALTKEGFADVLNRLLRAEASQKGIMPTQVYTSLRIDDPDGGVDAEVRDCTVTSEWIPLGHSIWQFKSGKVTPAKIKQEFIEALDVQDAITEGATYVLCIGADMTPRSKREREKALEGCFHAANLLPKYKVLTASEIAQWASQYLALSFLPQFQRPLGALMLWERWQQDRKFHQNYHMDAARNDICRVVRAELETGQNVIHNRHIRIEGQAGIGKTRLALEVFRPQGKDDGFHERVVYAATIEDVPRDLFHFVELNSKAELILVVDECGWNDRDWLEGQAQRCEGRLKLLTIGLAQEGRVTATRPDTYRLDKLENQTMRALLQEDYPRLPAEAADFVVHHASGFVKLAVTLAEAILEHPEKITSRELLQTQQMQEVISIFLVPDEIDRCALQAVALLNRTGWEGELASEGQAVSKFLRLEWREAQRRVEKFVRKGFVARQGRYRYVTPHLLAVTIAAQAWEAYNEQTLELLTQLPTPQSRRALLERLYDLGDDPQARRVTEMLLAEEGIFSTLDSINDAGRASIFVLLAEINPQSGLRALQRVIEYLPRSELLAFSRGRREVVSLLEKLAWSKQTFFGAARLLLQLADAENEHWANNASGTWVHLFNTFLGGTAVPALERHVLIQEALNSPSEAQQALAIKAIAFIFSLHETRTVGAEHQGGRLVEPAWRPQNYAEERAVRESGLALLDYAMVHTNPTIRAEARKVLLRQGRELVHFGLADAVIARLEQQPLTDQETRYELLRVVDELLEFEGSVLTPKQKQRLGTLREQVVGSSFADRLRRWTGRGTLTDWKRSREPGGRTMEQDAADLADEVANAPDLLRPELPYLATEAVQPYAFGKRLGELDASHAWWQEIEAFVRKGQGYALASAYLQGNIACGRKAWRDQVLDSWVNEANRELAVGLFDAVWRSEPNDADGERLIALLDRELLEAGRMGNLILGGMTRYFSTEVFIRLVRAVLNTNDEAATASALALIHQRLEFHSQDEQALAPYAWHTLERKDVLTGDTMTRFYAKELAERYQAHDPLRMARSILQYLETQDCPLLRSDEPLQILEQATRLQPKEVWEEVAAWVTAALPNRLQLYLALKGWYAQVVGTDVILTWAARHQPEGPRLVAAFTAVYGNPMDVLPRALLLEYGQDERVTDALAANFHSGSFMGDTSQWLEELRKTAESWTRDSHPNVRTWAQRLVEGLEREIGRWQLMESERRF